MTLLSRRRSPGCRQWPSACYRIHLLDERTGKTRRHVIGQSCLLFTIGKRHQPRLSRVRVRVKWPKLIPTMYLPCLPDLPIRPTHYPWTTTSEARQQLRRRRKAPSRKPNTVKRSNAPTDSSRALRGIHPKDTRNYYLGSSRHESYRLNTEYLPEPSRLSPHLPTSTCQPKPTPSPFVRPTSNIRDLNPTEFPQWTTVHQCKTITPLEPRPGAIRLPPRRARPRRASARF